MIHKKSCGSSEDEAGTGFPICKVELEEAAPLRCFKDEPRAAPSCFLASESVGVANPVSSVSLDPEEQSSSAVNPGVGKGGAVVESEGGKGLSAPP